MSLVPIAHHHPQLGEERQSGVKFLVYGNNATGEAWTLNPRIWSKVRKFLLSISSYLWHFGFVSGPLYESWFPPGWVGWYSTLYYTGSLRPNVQSLTFLDTTFHRKGTPFLYLFFRNGRRRSVRFWRCTHGKKVTALNALQTRGEGVSETPFPSFSRGHFQ